MPIRSLASDVDSLAAEVESLRSNVDSLSRRVRSLEKLEDTMDTSLPRRALFMLDGWPLFRVASRPQWRPWRRWWTS